MRKLLITLLTAAMVIVPMQGAEAKSPFGVSASFSASTLDFGGAVSVSGSVSPKAKYKKVYVQQLAGGAWHNIAVTKLSKKSKYAAAFVPRPGPQVYRVFKGSSKKKAAGTSAPFWITTSRWINLTDFAFSGFPVAPVIGTAVIGTSTPGLSGTYSYPNSLSVRSLGGDPGKATVNLAGRGCTKLETHIGIREGEHSNTEAAAYIEETLPTARTINAEGDYKWGQSARRVRVSIAGADVLVLRAISRKTPANLANETYLTFGSPMVYCAS